LYGGITFLSIAYFLHLARIFLPLQSDRAENRRGKKDGIFPGVKNVLRRIKNRLQKLGKYGNITIEENNCKKFTNEFTKKGHSKKGAGNIINNAGVNERLPEKTGEKEGSHRK